MKGGLRLAYACCLRAYPEAFHQVYGEEMSDVFAERVEEIGQQGAWALIGLAIRETWHILAASLRAHLGLSKKGF